MDVSGYLLIRLFRYSPPLLFRWELRKALQLMRDSNLNILEWLRSPPLYVGQASFVNRARELGGFSLFFFAPLCFDQLMRISCCGSTVIPAPFIHREILLRADVGKALREHGAQAPERVLQGQDGRSTEEVLFRPYTADECTVHEAGNTSLSFSLPSPPPLVLHLTAVALSCLFIFIA